MSPHEPSHAAAGIPLQAHVEELRSRCEAASRLQGGSTYYHEELGIFRSYAAEAGLFLQSPPAELSRPPDDEGNEHQVWFVPDAEAFLKATWPDFFGLLVIHRPNEEHKASPIAFGLMDGVFPDDDLGIFAQAVVFQERCLILRMVEPDTFPTTTRSGGAGFPHSDGSEMPAALCLLPDPWRPCRQVSEGAVSVGRLTIAN
jgi:hypothetical protein